MQNLINVLLAGQTEFKDGGVQIQHPATATQIRAAKTLSELNNQNVANQQIMVNQQQQITQLLEDLERLCIEKTNYESSITSLKQELENATKTIASASAVDTQPSAAASSIPVAEPDPAELPGQEHVL